MHMRLFILAVTVPFLLAAATMSHLKVASVIYQVPTTVFPSQGEITAKHIDATNDWLAKYCAGQLLKTKASVSQLRGCDATCCAGGFEAANAKWTDQLSVSFVETQKDELAKLAEGDDVVFIGTIDKATVDGKRSEMRISLAISEAKMVSASPKQK